jgi:hypothetical protein
MSMMIKSETRGGNRAGRTGSCWVGSGQFDSVRLSDHEFGRVGSGQISDLLVCHFRFRIISGQLGSIIGSSSVGYFRISSRIRNGKSNFFFLVGEVGPS